MNRRDGRRVCAYPWQQIIVDLTGEVVPCCFWSGYGNSGKPLGNTNLESLDTIWNGPAYRELRRRNASGDLEGSPCHECVAYRWGGGEYPGFSWPASFSAETGHCYTAPIPEAFVAAADAAGEPVRLLEDGVPLPHPDAIHDDIRRLGGGRYSVWGGTLYFSPSDNGDAMTAGRSYELRCGDARAPLRGMVEDCPSGRNLITAYAEYRAGAAELAAKPSMISFISTADCNIDCPACNQNLVRLLKVQHRPETEPDVLDHVPYLHQLIWHGGEPFLIRRFREFIAGFKTGDNPNLTFGFTTNGTMLGAAQLDELDKFPGVNASISMDSFTRETFERIRAGARFDRVLENVLRAVERYRTPDRVFSVGMIVAKSNFLELAESLDFAIEHDIGLNLSPVVVVPVHERLDVFESFARQTAGWEKTLAAARDVVSRAKAAGRPAIRRVDPEGMLDVLEGILHEASLRYANVLPLELHVDDPHDALATMRNPGVVLALSDEATRPLAYAAVPAAGTHAIELPSAELRGERDVYWQLVHDLDEAMGGVVDGVLRDRRGRALRGRFDQVPRALEIRVPEFKSPPRARRNILVANHGLPTADGLQALDASAQYAAYLALVRSEWEEGYWAREVGGTPARSLALAPVGSVASGAGGAAPSGRR